MKYVCAKVNGHNEIGWERGVCLSLHVDQLVFTKSLVDRAR